MSLNSIKHFPSVFAFVIFQNSLAIHYSQTHDNANTTCLSQGHAYRHTRRTNIWVASGFLLESVSFFRVETLYAFVEGGGDSSWSFNFGQANAEYMYQRHHHLSPIATGNFTTSFGRFIRAYLKRSGLHQPMQQALYGFLDSSSGRC